MATHVKDQGGFGSCWTFGTTAALEDFLELCGMSSDPDYSEMNMVYNLVKGSTRNNPYEFYSKAGGNGFMASSYYASGRGPVLEQYDRYEDGFDMSDPRRWEVKRRSYEETKSKPKDKYVRDMILLPSTLEESAFDRNNFLFFEPDEELKKTYFDTVKRFIIDNGSVATSMNWFQDKYLADSCLSNDGVNYYLPKELCNYHTLLAILAYYYPQYFGEYSDLLIGGSNHCVNIIGWDDNYPKENFVPRGSQDPVYSDVSVMNAFSDLCKKYGLEEPVNGFFHLPEHDGAFLIKNSWGEDKHDGGYFWLSYDDVFAASNIFAVTDVDEPKEKYNLDNIYQDDYFGMCEAFEVSDDNINECKIFDLRSPYEKLTDIGLFTANNDVKCEFYHAELDKSGKPVGIGEKLGEEFYRYAGYHTYAIDEDVFLDRDVSSKFGVIVKMSGEDLLLPVEAMVDGYSSKASGAPERNYASLDGSD